MNNLANASINTFGPSPKAGFESPSEQLITLTYGQLVQAVQEAIQPLQDEVSQLREEIGQDRREIASLHAKLASLEKDRDVLSDNQLIQLRLIHELKDKSNGPTDTEKERVERIEKLCSDAPNHEISLSELRGRLGIDKAVLSRLLKRINGDKFYLRKSTLDKRIRYLCLRPEVR
jgi:DNA-binding MarR family transcriptional regulator